MFRGQRGKSDLSVAWFECRRSTGQFVERDCRSAASWSASCAGLVDLRDSTSRFSEPGMVSELCCRRRNEIPTAGIADLVTRHRDRHGQQKRIRKGTAPSRHRHPALWRRNHRHARPTSASSRHHATSVCTCPFKRNRARFVPSALERHSFATPRSSARPKRSEETTD
jgi:hypothetical protein